MQQTESRYNKNPPEMRIEEFRGLLCKGISTKMSHLDNKTGELWKEFMTQLKAEEAIQHRPLYSIQEYPPNYFWHFQPQIPFTKWAAIAEDTPIYNESWTRYKIPQGNYAVFTYEGMAGNPEIFQYIFQEWLPQSGYKLRNAAHFEILGEDYKQGAADSKEEIWIPIDIS
ncbi:GyrI-like domain-containing protein [bacterium]|nr:GyrI-like domain-containing protein [bacterium]